MPPSLDKMATLPAMSQRPMTMPTMVDFSPKLIFAVSTGIAAKLPTYPIRLRM